MIRRMLRALFVASLVGAVVVPATVQAQYMMKIDRNDEPIAPADTVAQRAMIHDITHIRLAQDAYHSAYATYAKKVTDLPHLHLTSGATWLISDVTPTGWALSATHPRLTGKYRLATQRVANKAAAVAAVKGAPKKK